MKVLFVGRFQPFHNGHLRVVEHLIEEGHEVIIGIGSTQYSHDPRNPFTIVERKDMVDAALGAAGLKALRVVELKDMHHNDRWYDLVKGTVPDFDAVFSNSDHDRELFRERGEMVLEMELFDRERYEGTRIRQLMVDGGDWKGCVPGPVAGYLDRIDAVGRLRDILKRA